MKINVYKIQFHTVFETEEKLVVNQFGPNVGPNDQRGEQNFRNPGVPVASALVPGGILGGPANPTDGSNDPRYRDRDQNSRETGARDPGALVPGGRLSGAANTAGEPRYIGDPANEDLRGLPADQRDPNYHGGGIVRDPRYTSAQRDLPAVRMIETRRTSPDYMLCGGKDLASATALIPVPVPGAWETARTVVLGAANVAQNVLVADAGASAQAPETGDFREFAVGSYPGRGGVSTAQPNSPAYTAGTPNFSAQPPVVNPVQPVQPERPRQRPGAPVPQPRPGTPAQPASRPSTADYAVGSYPAGSSNLPNQSAAVDPRTGVVDQPHQGGATVDNPDGSY
jgi:hypothetical protein